MTIDPRDASAMLAEVDEVVARVKQSRIYRRSGDILIVWGALHVVRFVLFRLAPVFASVGWVAVDLVGVVATLWMLGGETGYGRRFPWRLAGAYALFYGFGWVSTDVIGAMGPRQLTAFWPMLFEFGFAVAGLWFGSAFLVIGIGAGALTLAAFLWSGAAYGLAISLVSAGSMIAAGLWMRRA